MPDQVVTATDSQEVTTNPQGTDAPANDLAQGTDSGAGAQAAPLGFDDEWLKTLDPASRQAFEEKFVPKPVFTQKTQALAEDRKKFEVEKSAVFELARRAIADRQQAPTGPTAEEVKRKELQDLAAAGDSQALQQLVQMEAERLVNPVKTQVALRDAYETAVRSNAYVAPHWNEIIQVMQNDPDIAAMASSNGMRGASKVMIALGLEREVMDLRPKYEAATKEIETLKAKLQGYEKERVAGLPSSTTRAGTTAGRVASGDATTLEEAAARAWAEIGGRPEDFR